MVYYDPSRYKKKAQDCKDNNGDIAEGSVGNNNEPRIPKPGDVDVTGPIQSGSWTLVPEGDGAHLIERSNVRGRSDLSMYDQPETPRYYPYGTSESAGQAHNKQNEISYDMDLVIDGMGIVLYSDGVVNDIEEGENYFSKVVLNLGQVIQMKKLNRNFRFL